MISEKSLIVAVLILFLFSFFGLSQEAEAARGWRATINKAMKDHPELPWKKRIRRGDIVACRDGGISVCVELGLAYDSMVMEFPKARLPLCVTPPLYKLACKRGAPAGCYLTLWHSNSMECTETGFGQKSSVKASGCSPMAEDSLMWSTNRKAARKYLSDFDMLCSGFGVASDAEQHVRAAQREVERFSGQFAETPGSEQESLNSALLTKSALGPTHEMQSFGVNKKTGEFETGVIPVDLTIVSQLIIQGANPNATDYEGNTALMNAVRYNNYLGARALLEAGARVGTLSGSGDTAFHMAAAQHGADTRILDVIIEFSTDKNLRNSMGDTPLMSATRAGNVWGVRILIFNGADASIKNNFGDTALDISRKSARDRGGFGHLEMRFDEIESILRSATP